MNTMRRGILQAGGGIGLLALAAAAGLIDEAFAEEWNKAAFDTKNFADTVKALGGAGSTESKDIQVTAPDIAENGAVVPVSIDSKVPKTQTISIMIEKNPNTLSASFDIPDGTDSFVTT